jgi:hypothetical protein
MKKIRNQIQNVSNFQELISSDFYGNVNAFCWNRELIGDFSEIVQKLEPKENIVEIDLDELCYLQLSENGNLAREILLKDIKLLTDHGASPVLNIIKNYARDNASAFFPTDVYSFHVDRSPIPTSTFLCTYHGEPSEILPNAQGIKKILIPEIRAELKKMHNGKEEDFEEFLREHFFDLHYQAQANAEIINLGTGNLWRIAVDHPESKVLPCLHRAPYEKDGKNRLLLIC